MAPSYSVRFRISWHVDRTRQTSGPRPGVSGAPERRVPLGGPESVVPERRRDRVRAASRSGKLLIPLTAPALNERSESKRRSACGCGKRAPRDSPPRAGVGPREQRRSACGCGKRAPRDSPPRAGVGPREQRRSACGCGKRAPRDSAPRAGVGPREQRRDVRVVEGARSGSNSGDAYRVIPKHLFA